MSMNEFCEDTPKRERAGTDHFWASKSLRRSGAAVLIDVASAIAAAQSIATFPAFCCRCKNAYNPNCSAAQFNNVFCSRPCEQEFVAAALASLTVEDCISLQERLLNLFTRPLHAPAV